MTLETEVEAGASGYSVTGGGHQGIFVKQVLKDSVAAKLFSLREGTVVVHPWVPIACAKMARTWQGPRVAGPHLELRLTPTRLCSPAPGWGHLWFCLARQWEDLHLPLLPEGWGPGGQRGESGNQARAVPFPPGDQLLSATIFFDDIKYEDALKILQYSEPYKVQFRVKRRLPAPEGEEVAVPGPGQDSKGKEQVRPARRGADAAPAALKPLPPRARAQALRQLQ